MHRPRDLFDLFPDLPWPRARPAIERVNAIRARVTLTRARALANARRQKAASEAIRRRLMQRRPPR
jgi:hypothetical protein